MAPTTGYDAFISYSHAADGTLAPSLRNGLHRFATTWRVFRWTNPVRSLRVFQDQASLSANPELWPTIENALASAEWFILLASPQAAASFWVAKEIEFWCQNRSAQRMLIVQTDGEIVWDSSASEFDWARTTALSNQLASAYRVQPHWIDARWVRTKNQASLRDPRFRDLVAQLSAPLRGVSKDELIGQDIQQARRMSLWRNSAFAIVSMLLVGVLVAAWHAGQQSKMAIDQRDDALRTQSLFLADLSKRELANGSSAHAVRLALEAMPKDWTNPDRPIVAEALAALYQSALENRERRVIAGHGAGTNEAKFSPDGRMLVTASEDGRARLWDAITGTELIVFVGHDNSVRTAEFSPNGKRLMTSSDDGTVRLWNVQSGRQLTVLHVETKGDIEANILRNLLKVARFSQDGAKVITVSKRIHYEQRNAETGNPDHDDEFSTFLVQQWNAKSGNLLHSYEFSNVEHWGFYSVALSPNGEKLLTVPQHDVNLRLLDTTTGELLQVFEETEGEFRFPEVVFDHQGRYLLTFSTSDSTATLWEVSSGEQMAKLRHDSGIVQAVFSRDSSTLAVATKNSSVWLWDVATGELLTWTPIMDKDSVFSRANSKWKNKGKIWESIFGGLESQEGFFEERPLVLTSHEHKVDSLAFSPDGKMLATLDRSELRSNVVLWNLASSRPLSPVAILRHEGRLRSAEFSPDGKVIITVPMNRSQGVRLWDAAPRSEIAILRHPDEVYSAFFSSDGTRLVTASRDNVARVWDPVTKELFGVLRGHEGPVTSASFNVSGSKLVTSSRDGTVRLWDARLMRKEMVLIQGKSAECAVFSPDETKVAAGFGDGSVRVWDSRSGKELDILEGGGRVSRGTVRSIDFNRDGTELVAGARQEVRLWDLSSGKELAVLGHEDIAGGFDRVASAVFARSKRKIVTFLESGRIFEWDVESLTRRPLFTPPNTIEGVLFPPENRYEVWTGSISSNGTFLVTSGAAGALDVVEGAMVRLFDAVTGIELAALRGHDLRVMSAAFSPDGEKLVTASKDKTARVWRIPSNQAIIELARSQVPQPFSCRDRERFFLQPRGQCEKRRLASNEEAIRHLRGEWAGITVNGHYGHRREMTMTIAELNGKEFSGKGLLDEEGGCQEFVFSGQVKANRIFQNVTAINVSNKATSRCEARGRFELEMLIGDNGIPRLTGSYFFGVFVSGNMELTKVR